MRILTTVAAVLLATPLMAQTMPEPKTATFINAEGAEIGTAEVRPAADGILISVDVSGLPDGPLGFHIHENGVCEGNFESAGGHYNPDDATHGYFSENGPHAGDMPNQPVDADGNMMVDVMNPMVGFDEVSGKAIMIHDGADDYMTDPSGDAGGRFACAVVE